MLSIKKMFLFRQVNSENLYILDISFGVLHQKKTFPFRVKFALQLGFLKFSEPDICKSVHTSFKIYNILADY